MRWNKTNTGGRLQRKALCSDVDMRALTKQQLLERERERQAKRAALTRDGALTSGRGPSITRTASFVPSAICMFGIVHKALNVSRRSRATSRAELAHASAECIRAFFCKGSGCCIKFICKGKC